MKMNKKKSCKTCRYNYSKEFTITPCHSCKRNYSDNWEAKSSKYVVTYHGQYVRDATQEEIECGIMLFEDGQNVECETSGIKQKEELA